MDESSSLYATIVSCVSSFHHNLNSEFFSPNTLIECDFLLIKRCFLSVVLLFLVLRRSALLHASVHFLPRDIQYSVLFSELDYSTK